MNDNCVVKNGISWLKVVDGIVDNFIMWVKLDLIYFLYLGFNVFCLGFIYKWNFLTKNEYFALKNFFFSCG